MRESDLELHFKLALKTAGKDLPQPEQEYRFHPTRKWRVDFAWPDYKLAVECEGGIYSQGRHTRVKGFLDDIEKYNALAESGWRILRFANPHIVNTPSAMVDQIRRCLT